MITCHHSLIYLQIAESFVTYADLECVDYQYLLCGRNDGGVAVYDTSVIKEGRLYNEVGSVNGHQRRSHKYQVWYGINVIQYITIQMQIHVLYCISTLYSKISHFSILYFRLNVLSGTQQTQECSAPPAGTRKLKYGTQIT